MSEENKPSKSLADEIKHFQEELSEHESTDDAVKKAKAALRAKIFESDPLPEESNKTKKNPQLNEVDQNIEKFLQEQEAQRKEEERLQKEREEIIRRAHMADPKELESSNFALHPAKADDPSDNIYQDVDENVTDAERQAKINENIELHLRLQQEIEEKKRQEKEQLKAAEKQKEKMAGGKFVSSGRQQSQTGFAEITDDITKQDFLKQSIILSDYVFVIEGMEALFLSLYFVIFPYVTGLMVLFFFVAQRDIGNFLVFDIFTIIPVWAIGYETLAAIIMLSILRSWLSFHFRKQKALKKAEKALRAKVRRMEKSRTKFR